MWPKAEKKREGQAPRALGISIVWLIPWATLILNFYHPEVLGDRLLLFKATEFIVTCT